MIMDRKMERKKTFTMNWDGLHDQEDDSFFESRERMSSAVPIDLQASSSDDDDFDDSRMSFASCASSLRNDLEVEVRALSGAAAEPSFSSPPLTPDYNIWMAAPGSISERRRRLMQGMGLANGGRDIVSFKRIVSSKPPNGVVPAVKKSPTLCVEKIHAPEPAPHNPEEEASNSPLQAVLVRSRSDGEIEAFSADKWRKEEVIGAISKQRLTRTSSTIAAPSTRMFSYPEVVATTLQSDGGARAVRSRQNSTALWTEFTNNLGAFFLIKNLDTGTEFIVNEYDQNGCWNKFSDLQTGKKLTMDEFEKSVGYSPVVKEVMRRQNVTSDAASERKVGSPGANSFVSKSLRMSKRKVALLKNSIKGVGSAVSVLIGDKDQHPPLPLPQDQKPSKSNEWIKVRQNGKSYKELSALHLCQEIQAHEGSIWTIKFSLDARFLASAGEDRVIHVWEVQECEIMSMDSNATPLHPSLSQDRSGPLSSEAAISSEKKKKKGKGGSSRKTNPIPDYVHVPEFVFALSEKPVCSFEGHLDAVLDLSWSRDQLLLSSSMDKTVRLWDMETKSCLKMFAHNDYVTCIQFNPLDDNVFLSGSLDAKLRLWDIPARKVVDWTDLHEMVTAACYTPDGQAAITGSHKGNCRMYNAEEATFEVLPRLNEIKFGSGVIDELLFLDLPRECRFPSGVMMLEYGKAVQESVYEQLRVVREGQLRIVFTQDLKILSWEFCARRHEELLPRRLVAPQVHQLVQVAQKCQSTIAESGSEGVSQQDLQTNSNLVLTAGRQLAKSLELQSLNDLGFSKRYVRCLQISEVVNSMKDLIDFCRESKVGPIEGLKVYPRHASANKLQMQKMQEMEQLASIQGMPTDRNTLNKLMALHPGLNNQMNNNQHIASRGALSGSAQVAALTNYQNLLMRQNSMNSNANSLQQEASSSFNNSNQSPSSPFQGATALIPGPMQSLPGSGFSSPHLSSRQPHQTPQLQQRSLSSNSLLQQTNLPNSQGNQALQQHMIQQLLQEMSNNSGGQQSLPGPNSNGKTTRNGMSFGGNNSAAANATPTVSGSHGPAPSRSNSFKAAANSDSSAGGGSNAFNQRAQDLPSNLHLQDDMVQDIAREFTENGFFNNDLDDSMGYGWKA